MSKRRAHVNPAIRSEAEDSPHRGMPEETAARAANKRATGYVPTLHHAVWTRILLVILKFMPAPLALALAVPVSFACYCLAGSQRRALISNIRALCPEIGYWDAWTGGARVFLQYARTYLDRLWHMYFKVPVSWEVEGMENFETLRDHPGGVLVFTAHSGNYDIGAALFAGQLGRKLATVRAPEREADMRDLREAELSESERSNPNLRVLYNEADSHLGLALLRALNEGEVVAVQADRVVDGISPMQVVIDGMRMRLPKGPFSLAVAAQVPCYPVFLTRVRRCHYRIEFPPLLRDTAESDDSGPLRALSHNWARVLLQFIRSNWDQWYVFESTLERVSDAPRAEL